MNPWFISRLSWPLQVPRDRAAVLRHGAAAPLAAQSQGAVPAPRLRPRLRARHQHPGALRWVPRYTLNPWRNAPVDGSVWLVPGALRQLAAGKWWQPAAAFTLVLSSAPAGSSVLSFWQPCVAHRQRWLNMEVLAHPWHWWSYCCLSTSASGGSQQWAQDARSVPPRQVLASAAKALQAEPAFMGMCRPADCHMRTSCHRCMEFVMQTSCACTGRAGRCGCRRAWGTRGRCRCWTCGCGK